LATEIIQREKELMANSPLAENVIDSDQRHGAA